MAGLPLPYFMAVVGMTVLPYIIFKVMLWLPSFALWYVLARSVTAINPNGHRIITSRFQFMPIGFWFKPIRFQRSQKGRVTDV